MSASTALSAAIGAAVPTAAWALTTATLTRRLQAARRDPLTGLPTRAAFTARATRALRSRPALLVLVDLDGFKALNDTRGHQAGDAVLAATAARLMAWAGPARIAGRLGGDEFTAVLPLPPAARDAAAPTILTALHTALTRPVPHGGLLLPVGASVGGHLTTRATTLTDALACADAAMYQAKRTGGGWRLATGDLARPGRAPRRWHRTDPAPHPAATPGAARQRPTGGW